MTGAGQLTSSERDWLRVRRYLQQHRYELAVAASGDYPAGMKVAGTPLLAARCWRPTAPVPLRDIKLTLHSADDTLPPAADALMSHAALLLPERADGTPYRRYSDAVSGAWGSAPIR